jgi:hypothetical protein
MTNLLNLKLLQNITFIFTVAPISYIEIILCNTSSYYVLFQMLSELLPQNAMPLALRAQSSHAIPTTHKEKGALPNWPERLCDR